MNISGKHSGDKRKFKHRNDKGKMKKYGTREVFMSLEQMINVGKDLASITRSHQKAYMMIDECVSKLLSSRHVEEGVPFLRVKKNRSSPHATKNSYLWYKFIEYYFKHDNQSFLLKG